MIATRRAVLVGALALGATACASTNGRIVQGSYTSAQTFTVNLGRQWSDITFMLPNRPPNVKMLSIDGPLLNRLCIAALRPGESLLRHADRDTPRAIYRTDMSESELVEFVVDCVAQEYQSPQSSALRPQQFAGAPGVRFDLSANTAEGLNMSGTALVAQRADRLQVLLFLAPSEHYYGALLPEVEAVFGSAVAVAA
jgi:hypothetical protein